jgi:hypothetical protein
MEYPIMVESKIHPIRKKKAKDDRRYVIGENGSIISIRTGEKYKKYKYIDWVATLDKITQIWNDMALSRLKNKSEQVMN